jgi:hypothetical protein
LFGNKTQKAYSEVIDRRPVLLSGFDHWLRAMGLDGNDRSVAAFTMLGHGLVHWFEMSIPILLVVWLRVFPESVTLVGLIVALGYAPFGLGALPVASSRTGTAPSASCSSVSPG